MQCPAFKHILRQRTYCHTISNILYVKIENTVNLTVKVSSRKHENLNQAYDPYSLAGKKTSSPKTVSSSLKHISVIQISLITPCIIYYALVYLELFGILSFYNLFLKFAAVFMVIFLFFLKFISLTLQRISPLLIH